MIREKLLAELERARKIGDGIECRRDPELAHSIAEDALLTFVNDEEISAAYNAIYTY